jgi:hypothetical protein
MVFRRITRIIEVVLNERAVTNKVLNKKIIFLFSKFLVPLHYQELFDRSVLQIAEFTTVAKSLPYSL